MEAAAALQQRAAGVFQGFVSFLLPCFAVDHLYLSYDEYLLSEEDTPLSEGEPLLLPFHGRRVLASRRLRANGAASALGGARVK